MRLIPLALLALLASLCISAAHAAQPPARELVGSWQLVAAIPDEWGRLVIETGGMRTVLKRINRDGNGKAVMPPLRIVLGYARGSE